MRLSTGISRPLTRAIVTIALTAGLAAMLLFPFDAAGQDDPLTGDYSVTIAKNDVPDNLANGPDLIGQWHITFGPDGTYTAERRDIGTAVTGSYEVDGDRVTITDEDGLLSCADAQAADDAGPDQAAATYQWTRDGQKLTLKVKDESCGLRRVLLTTHAFGAFVACMTQGPSSNGDATPAAATPEAELGQLLEALGTPEATPGVGDVEAGVDDLLSQLTACWATGDPERVLPLFSKELQQRLADEAGSKAGVAKELAPLLAAPVTWSRSGDIRQDDDTHASAVVSIKLAENETFQRLDFVFEEGKWLLDTLSS